MEQKITTNLWYDDDALEAAEFYVGVFGGDSRIVNVVHYTEAGPRPAGDVMIVEFELAGQPFIAINGGPAHFTHTEAISLAITCETQEEIDHFWERLSEGGEESVCGWLKDRYGVSWQVTPPFMAELFADEDKSRAERAARAMFGMKKLDIAALKAAADGVAA